jgi:hypothetical protein
MEFATKIAGMPEQIRARLYREHKYVFFAFSELVQLIGSLDFCAVNAVFQAKERLQDLRQLLEGHAHYEESRIHALLKSKHSLLFKEAEGDHEKHHLFFNKAEKDLNDIEDLKDPEAKNHRGNEFYLDLREFFARNVIHFDYEERVILPELQKLVDDESIREIDSLSYRQMTPSQMIHMMEVLFPHMNPEDRFTFLKDIKNCQPKKFEMAWDGIAVKIEEEERESLRKSLKIPSDSSISILGSLNI